MVNKRIIRLVSALLMVLFIYSPCTALDFKEGQIQSISKGIEKGRENDSEVEFCSSFSLNKRQVVKYFKRAKTVPKGWPSHDLDWVACFVEGTIKTKAGLIKWQINATCASVIEWPNGETQYFYYADCERM